MTYILVTDDDEFSKELLRFTLQSLGYEVECASDGQEGLNKARTKPPDMIFSDILMPEMDGFEFCRAIKTDKHLRHIPFIFYTATYVSVEDEQLAKAAGGAGFIRKGIDSDRFQEVVKETISKCMGTGDTNPETAVLPQAELDRMHEKAITRKLAKKMAELKVERSSRMALLELLEAVFDATMSAVIAMNSEGRIIVWNKSACEIFGYTVHEALGKDLHSLIVPPQHLAKTRKPLDHFFQSGQGPILGKNIELVGMRKDGSTFPVSLNVSSFKRDGTWHAAATVSDISKRKAMESAQEEAAEELRNALISGIGAIAATLDIRDPYTSGHQRRVSSLCVAIGVEMGLTENQLEGLRLGALIHDIGKVSVPAEILSKPSRLSDIELALVREHSQIGHDIVKDVKFPWPIGQMILQHHERQNGSGYPKGLSGDEIIIEARILAVADVVEAICSHRPYRAARGMNEAIAELHGDDGTRYDKASVEACLRVLESHGMQLPP